MSAKLSPAHYIPCKESSFEFGVLHNAGRGENADKSADHQSAITGCARLPEAKALLARVTLPVPTNDPSDCNQHTAVRHSDCFIVEKDCSSLSDTGRWHAVMSRVLLPAFPHLWQHVFAQGLLSRTSPLHSLPSSSWGTFFVLRRISVITHGSVNS